MSEAMGPEAQLVSIVVPCFDEESVLPQTLDRLDALAGRLAAEAGLDCEVICVDDGSRDGTFAVLEARAARDPRLRVIRFARNFGHQIAVTAGIDAARGDAVVLIDADLQDPPEVVLEMAARWREGWQVVFGRRVARDGESGFKRLTARLFYRLLDRLSEVPMPLDTGDFRLMDRRVVEALRAMPERDRFIRGMVSWVGFRQTALPYRREERRAGESKYPLRRMLRFAADGIFSFSTRPLQISIGLGLASAFLALLGILYAVVMRIFTENWVEGWTALMLAVLFLGGVQLICIGILGEYVGRIYRETKGRPLYIVSERLGAETDASARAEGTGSDPGRGPAGPEAGGRAGS